MALFKNNRIKKNKEHLYSLCEKYIMKYENPYKNSCKADLMASIKNYVETSSDVVEFFSDDTNDWDYYSNNFIANCSFNLLASGRYNLYTGVINPMKCGNNLLKTYDGAMSYAVEIGEITEEAKKEQREMLMKQISQVG